MNDSHDLFAETISISYALLLLEITSGYGIKESTVLVDTGLFMSNLQQPERKMSAHQWSKLVMNALDLTKNDRLGIEYGFKLRLTSHGSLGFAFLSSDNLKTFLNVGVQYFCTRIQSFSPSWVVEDQDVFFYLYDLHPIKFGNEAQSRRLRCFLVESLLFGTVYSLQQFLNEEIEFKIFVDWDETEDYKKNIPLKNKIIFNSYQNYLCFPEKYLNLSYSNADKVAFNQAINYCEYDKSKITTLLPDDFKSYVKSEIYRHFNYSRKFPNICDIAHNLKLSERTLRRHLLVQKTSFTQILNDVKFDEARNLLKNPQISIHDISEQLGYSETTNFIRAFKKNYGKTPMNYRESEN